MTNPNENPFTSQLNNTYESLSSFGDLNNVFGGDFQDLQEEDSDE